MTIDMSMRSFKGLFQITRKKQKGRNSQPIRNALFGKQAGPRDSAVSRLG